MKSEVILERYPYRFVLKGLLEENGAPDFCIEDREYVKWLDPDPDVAAYPRKGDTVVSPYGQ